MLALGPIAELDAEQMTLLFRRRALYVIGGAIVFAVIYALLSWLKYSAYMDARYDLGNMVQAVYNTAHGHFLEITSGDLKPRQMSRLGSHVDPILALFALPWLVWPSPVMLLVAQAAIVATGAWPAYRLGTRVTRDPRAGAFLAGAYLLYPALGFLVLNEFHPVALATPLLLWAFLYMEEDRWVRAAVFLVLAARLQGDRAAGDRLHGRVLRAPQAFVVAAHRHGARRRRTSPSRSGWSSRTSTATRAPSSPATATTAAAPGRWSRTPCCTRARRWATSSPSPTCATGWSCCGRSGSRRCSAR